MQPNTTKALGLFVVAALAFAVYPAQAQTSTGFGTVVAPLEADTTYILNTLEDFDTFCYVDDDDSGTFNGDEAVYFNDNADGTVSANAVRVANAPTGGLGSQVRTGDNDFDDPCVTDDFAEDVSDILFVDNDGDDKFSAGDVAVLNTDDDTTTTVNVNDIVLSGTDAGRVVGSGHSLLNRQLEGTDVFAAMFFDVDGDNQYTRGDIVYFDITAFGSNYATVQDLRFTAPAFGRVVAPNEPDTTYVLGITLDAFEFCFVDDDDSGTFNGDEAVYLNNGTAVEANAIRVANPPTGGLGSQVRTGDNDFDDPCTPLGTIDDAMFVDNDGDDKFSSGDVAVLNTDDGGSTVTVNDIVLSGTDAGRVVGSGHSLLNRQLEAGAGFLVTVFDADGDAVYTRGDVIYLNVANANATSTGFVTVQDIRFAGSTFGQVVAAGNFDATYVLNTNGTLTGFCFVDDDDSGTFNGDEAVYLNDDSGNVVANAIRVSNPPTGGLGSQVRTGDNDFDDPCSANEWTLSELLYVDNDGDDVFSAGDVLVLDTDTTGGTVTVNDIVLSGTDAGRVVGSGHSLLNRQLESETTFALTYFDADGDEVYTRGDVPYLDAAEAVVTGTPLGNGFATVQDVRLSGARPTQTTGGPITTGTTTSGSVSTTNTTSSSTSTSGSLTSSSTSGTGGNNPGTTDDDGEGGNNTPGFELVALVGALAVALVLVRRKL